MAICQKLPNWILVSRPVQRLLSDRAADERSDQATAAFAALGPIAAPAIPELARRAASNKLSLSLRRDHALLALTHLGPPAVPIVAALLAKPDEAGNSWMMMSIRDLGTNARPLVPLIVRNLSLTNWFVAMINVRLLGEMKMEPDLVLPALIRCLHDSRREVRMEAPGALAEFGSLASGALPALTNALADPDPDVRNNAGRAIIQISTKQP